MRHRITIKSPPVDPTDQDEYGQPVGAWVDVATLWASSEPLIGNEFYSAEAAQSKVEIKFRIRYNATITDKMRVYFNSIPYEILSLADIQSRNREMLIYCKKVI